MKIVVCLKQVPASGPVSLGADGRSVLAAQAGMTLNPFDAFAIEAALRVKQATGGDITALTAGPQEATSVLREAFTLGANQALHILGETRDLNSMQVAYLLAAAIQSLDGAELILTGQESTVANGGAVAPMLAEFLGIPHIAGIRSVEANPAGIRVERSRGRVLETLGADFPVLLTVSREIGEPRPPSVREVLAARKIPIPVVEFPALPLEEEVLKRLGRVYTRTCELVPSRGGGEILAGSIEQQTLMLCQKLIADGILQEGRDA